MKNLYYPFSYLLLYIAILQCSTFKIKLTNFKHNIWYNHRVLQLHVSNKITIEDTPISKRQGVACSHVEDALIPTIKELYPKLLMQKIKVQQKKFLYVNKENCTYLILVKIRYSPKTLDLKKVNFLF